jgi:hypothetical protein
MKGDQPDSDQASPAVAIIGMCVLGGSVLAPGAFIFYGGGGSALFGLMILGLLILCQAAVFAICKRCLGSRRK